jgi:hypothetical protein
MQEDADKELHAFEVDPAQASAFAAWLVSIALPVTEYYRNAQQPPACRC